MMATDMMEEKENGGAGVAATGDVVVAVSVYWLRDRWCSISFSVRLCCSCCRIGIVVN